MKIRIFVVIVMFISICAQTNAQIQILFQSDQTKSFLLTHVNSFEESQQVINEIISNIAQFVPKPVYQTKITLNVDENVKITRQQTVVSIYVSYQNVVLNGDVFYKGFNMTDVLIPSKYEFAGMLSYKKGAVIKEFIQPATNFNPFNEIVLQCNDTALTSNYDFIITSTKFYYDNATRNRFRDKAILIDQYYTADLDLNNINKQLSEINPNAFEEIEKTQKVLDNFKIMTENISNAAFWQALHIEMFDPVNLKPKLFDIRKKQTELQNQINYTISVLHEHYYNKALKLYNDKKTYEAKTTFEKSLIYNPVYAPSKFYLAQIAFETNKTEDSRQLIQELFTFKDIDDNTLRASKGLVRAIEWTDMNGAIGLLTSGKYTEALVATDKAENFCKNIPAYTCNDTLNLIRRDCHRGIYANFIKSADNLYVLKKYKEAGNEILKAIVYQQKYSNFIPDNEEALVVKQKIGTDEYYYAMTKGKEKMIARDYREAFEDFNNAKNLENDYPVKKDKLLPELLKKSKLETLLLDLDDAKEAVDMNNLVKARNILRQVIDEQKVYGLNDNAVLSQKIETLKKSIFSLECTNAQNEYDSKINAATKAQSEKSFIAAENSYKEALSVVEKNPDCSISSEAAKRGITDVEKPSQYQQTLNQCNNLVKNNDYYKAIDLYNKLTSYYAENAIANYNITHQPLHNYIASFESGFVTYGLTWLIDAGETDNALYLLKILKQRNILKSTTKIQQTSLARSYALKDHKAGNVADPKVKVTEYTLGDKWFSYFEKEYVKQMKKLK
ncbi:MAG TPA: hypothetical protein PKW80_12420 [Bacteroidales bacterium]|nr:hypothetical protein [Bacteroidales bacterium]